MNEKKSSGLFRAVKALVRAVYPKITVEGLENLPAGEAVLVGNHAQIHGPISAELYLGDDRWTWCAGQMMNRPEIAAYAYQDFWSQKPAATRWVYKGLSHLIVPLALFIFGNANAIPVYRDARVLATFRETLDRLAEGDKIVIFPEHDVPRNDVLCDFQDRFVDVARLYYGKCRKELSFIPMYVAPRLKKIVLGTPIPFDAQRPIEEERRRICEALMDAVTALCRTQPRHVVIPYRNISKKDYPVNRPD